jgi:hypothetical protein
VRTAWYVERIAQKATGPHWQAERKELNEVFEDLRAAKEAGDHFRFIAPAQASDTELNALLRRGAMPTFLPRPILPATQILEAQEQLELLSGGKEGPIAEAPTTIVAKLKPVPASIG